MAAPASAPTVRKLEQTVINRIAAGEVIVRPASALKEMIENSLDAGSTSIIVTCKQGGIKMLQIQDNGHGIRVEDYSIVCERFTTSKLQKFEDLHSIGTFGFRGEALASISHVAHLTITSMTAQSPCAYKATFADGKLVPARPHEDPAPKPCAGVRGTTILVEDLFFNVPTRRKALKNPSEEYGKILEVVSRYALQYPLVSFTCKKHGETSTDVHTPANSNTLDNIRTLFGATVARELLPFECADSSLQMKANGFISNANYSVRKAVFILFINNRLVDCSNIKKSLEAIYAQYLPRHTHPFLFVSLTLAPHSVDVNVHPTKREVDFLHADAIIEVLQKTVEQRLVGANESRTFYTQAVLPGATPVSTEQEERPKSDVVAPHKLVRTDSTNPTGAMEKYIRNVSKTVTVTEYKRAPESTSEPAPEATPAITPSVAVPTQTAPKRRRLESERTQLSSVAKLREVCELNCHSGLLEMLSQHTFVGAVDTESVLIQFKTKLLLVNGSILTRELIYQSVLDQFEFFSPIVLAEPLPVCELIQMALENQSVGWTIDMPSKTELAQAMTDSLMNQAEMLKEYFCMELNERSELCSLPQIIDEYIPDLRELPLFLLRLVTEVNWSEEQPCFESIARELAEFYSRIPETDPLQTAAADSQRMDVETTSSGSEQPEASPSDRINNQFGSHYGYVYQHIMFPAMRTSFYPPKVFSDDGTFLEVASLEKMYKIFERC